MRRGLRDMAVITTEVVDRPGGRKTGGQVIGINLGWDFTAEHEWGIRGLRSTFGIPAKPERRSGIRGLASRDLVGADVRTITKVPSTLRFFENLDGCAYLIYGGFFALTKEKNPTSKTLDGLLDGSGEREDLSTAWDESSFGIRMKNDVLKSGATVLGQIYEALKKKDAMIFLGGRGNSPFSNRGLIIAVRSRMPQDALQQMQEADTDHLNLMDAVEKVYKETGLKERLESAGRKYFALSPRWASSIHWGDDGEDKTKYSVAFSLNPEDQGNNNAGWYTVEQLLEWADGRGPVLKVATPRSES